MKGAVLKQDVKKQVIRGCMKFVIHLLSKWLIPDNVHITEDEDV